MRAFALCLFVLLIAVPTVRASEPWRLLRAEDGSLWVYADGARHRIEPQGVSDADLATIPEAVPWPDGVLGVSGWAPPAIPPRPTASFGDGTYRVGPDIAPGTYRADNPGGTCYWARLRGFSGTLAEIAANETPKGPAIATILDTDVGFVAKRCGTWTPA